MAIDTRNKRMSLIGFGTSLPRILPDPDSSFNAADRAMLIYLYPGLTLSTGVGQSLFKGMFRGMFKGMR